MKIRCERERLLAAFQTVAPVVPNRTTREILRNVKLEVEPDQATLLATDGEIGVRAELIGLEVERPGAAILPTARFGAILRELSDDQLLLWTHDNGLVVKGVRSEFQLPSVDPAEFPAIAPFHEERFHTIAAPALRELIRRTVFTTDEGVAKYALGGLLLELTADKITLVGTDTRRMAVVEGPAQAHEGHATPSDGHTIVHARAMTIIERALSDSEAECQIAVRGSDVLVRGEAFTIYTRLLEGRFPNWRQVLPKRGESHTVTFPVGPLHAAVKQAAIVTDQENLGVDFTFNEEHLVLSARAAQSGASKVELPISYSGPEITIKLNPKFVSDFLRVLAPDQNITVELRDGESPAIFATDDNYRYVVMPLAL